MQKKTIKFKAKLFFENNIIPTDFENLSGLIFVFCGSIFALTGRRGRRPLQGGIQLLYEKQPFASGFLLHKKSLLPSGLDSKSDFLF